MKSRFWNRRPPVSGRRMILEALEERIVMDAAIDSIPETHALDHVHTTISPYDPIGFLGIGNSLVMKQLIAGMDSHQAPPVEHVSHAADKGAAVGHSSLDVVLVSDALEGKKEIVAAASPNAKVIVYSAANDNLDSLNAKLGELVSSSGKKISHLAVASHGADGILQIGSDKLDFASALAHRSSFQSLAKNLDSHAQIQLYSCSLAGDDEGKDLVNSIAFMTGADVFASTDVTGAKPHNWTLEYASYPKAPLASIFDAAKLEKVPGELAQQAITNLPAAGVSPLFNAHIDSFGREIPGVTPMPIVNANQVVFAATADGTNGTNGFEVYRTNSATPGAGQTALTTLPQPNPQISELLGVNGSIYYSAYNKDATGALVDPGTGFEVIRTTPAGVSTVVSDFADQTAAIPIAPPLLAYNPHISLLTPNTVNDAVYFVGEQPANYTPGGVQGFEVWRTNGGAPVAGAQVTDGTGNVGNISNFNFVNAVARGYNPEINEIVAASDGTTMYFKGNSPNTAGDAIGLMVQGHEVWRSNGGNPNGLVTAGGNAVITDFGQAPNTLRGAISDFADMLHNGFQTSGPDPDISQLTSARNGTATVYFVGNDAGSGGAGFLGLGYEVWKSDGTEPIPGTQITQFVGQGATFSAEGNVTNFATQNPDIHDLTAIPGTQRIYMVANNTAGTTPSYQIWRSDGTAVTAAGNVTDRGALPETTFTLPDADISQLAPGPNGDLYFVANNGGGAAGPNYEVWRLPAGGGAQQQVTVFPDAQLPATARTGIPTDVPLTDPIRAQLPPHWDPHIKLLTFTADGTLWFEADSLTNTSREIFSVNTSAPALAAPQQPFQRTNFGYANPEFGFITDDGGVPVFVAQLPNNDPANPADQGQQIFTIANTLPTNRVPANNNADALDLARRTVLEDNNNHNDNVALHNLIRVTDPDLQNALSVQVNTISGFTAATGNPAGLRALEFTVPAGSTATATPNVADGSQWTITAPASWVAQDDINTVLSTMTAHLTRDTNSNTDTINATTHTIRVTTSDGVGANVVNDINLNVVPVNDQPVLNPSTIGNEFPGTMWGGIDRFPVPGVRPTPVIPQVVAAGDNLIFNDANLNRIAIDDVDAYEILGALPQTNGVIHVNLLSGGGSLRLANTTGLTFDPGSSNDQSSIGFQGTLTNINAALNGLRFRPAAYFEGASGITLILDDTNPYLPAAFAPPTAPLALGTGGHTGEPESGQITTVTAANVPVQPFTSTVPRTEPVVASIPITVAAPSGNFFGRLYDQP
jgi:hypothetical protein